MSLRNFMFQVTETPSAAGFGATCCGGQLSWASRDHSERALSLGHQSFPKRAHPVRGLRADGSQIVLASSAKGLADSAASSQDAERSKPAPDIFQGPCKRLGDTPHDAQAAKDAGLRMIGVLCGGFAEHDLREAGCAAIYRDPSDLLDRYAESPLAA